MRVGEEVNSKRLKINCFYVYEDYMGGMRGRKAQASPPILYGCCTYRIPHEPS